MYCYRTSISPYALLSQFVSNKKLGVRESQKDSNATSEGWTRPLEVTSIDTILLGVEIVSAEAVGCSWKRKEQKVYETDPK